MTAKNVLFYCNRAGFLPRACLLAHRPVRAKSPPYAQVGVKDQRAGLAGRAGRLAGAGLAGPLAGAGRAQGLVGLVV